MLNAIEKRMAKLTPSGESQWTLVRNSDVYLESQVARAGFNWTTGQMHLASDATYLDYFHELCHAIQRAELGLEGYKKLRRFDREMYVFDQIAKYDYRFTDAEIDRAIEDALIAYREFGPKTLFYMLEQ